MLIRPGRISPYTGSQRPLWPFTINRGSWQADGLIGWWPLPPLGGVNSTQYDFSGNLNHGTMTNFPSDPWGAQVFLGGQALEFDGTNDAVDGITDNPSLRPATLTYAGWINSRDTSGADQETIIYSKESNAPWNKLSLTTTGVPRFTLTTTSATVDLDGPTALDDEEWHHVAGTWDGATTRIYVAGLEVNSAALTGTANYTTELAAVGRRGVGGGGQFWDGFMAEVRCYNYALSSAQVYALFDASTRWDLYYPLRQVMPLSALIAVIGTGGSGNSPIFRVKHSPWGYM